MSDSRFFRRALGYLGALSSVGLAACGDDGGTGGGGGEAPAAGSVEVQISGEDFGPEGFLFPTGSEVAISDGWEIRFDHVFVTVGAVHLSENPDMAPADQSQTGEVVARVEGPWAVDLAKQGTVPGAGGEGTATPLLTIADMTERGGAPFEADQRYAFGFTFVEATADATAVNFADDSVATSAYGDAATDGCVITYAGTATWKGGDSCVTSDDSYDFSQIPTEVSFRLCFRTPVESLNCQNEENDGEAFPDEEFQRGISMRVDGPSLAQITAHLDHPFYSDVQHEPLLYFDTFAAQLVGVPEGTVLTMELLESVDPTAMTDGAGAPLPWRSCDGTPIGDGQRAFDAGSIPVGPGQDPSEGFRHYADFVNYVTSTMGHLNGGEGLCYAERAYPSPQ